MSVGLVFSVPVALAVPPTNDKFVDAESLGPDLPITAIRTNVGATKESDDPSPSLFGAKGRSVWFEWEANVDGLVTVGTCGSDFETVLGVYTGGSLDELAEVARGDNRGPNCPFGGREATFEAASGTTYAIFVDGDPFYLPPATPPSGEGTIELQIDPTPLPPNDNFQDAAQLNGEFVDEEKTLYLGSQSGFNWNAGKQVDEPTHGGGPGGASVWHQWTAPRSGAARVTVDCQDLDALLGVYTGGSLDSLNAVGTESHCAVEFDASAGTTYRIAVDGDSEAESNPPSMGPFSLHLRMESEPIAADDDGNDDDRAEDNDASVVPQAAPPILMPLADTTPPRTFVRKRRLIHRKRMAGFFFRSSEPGRRARCKLDRRRWAFCRSPAVYRRLRPGRHVFRVAAIDSSGNVDPSPAIVRFKIKRGKHQRAMAKRRQGRRAGKARNGSGR